MNFNELSERLAEHTERIVRENQIAIEGFTEKQVVETIRQVITSGDLIKLVIVDTGAQQVIYIPYEVRHIQLERIKRLEEQLRKHGVADPDQPATASECNAME